jgi:hypothetical protein
MRQHGKLKVGYRCDHNTSLIQLRKAESDNVPRNCCPKLPPKTPRVVIAGVQEPWYIFAVWSAAVSLDEKGQTRKNKQRYWYFTQISLLEESPVPANDMALWLHIFHIQPPTAGKRAFGSRCCLQHGNHTVVASPAHSAARQQAWGAMMQVTI